MAKNLIFVFEFVSGGGFSKTNIPTSIFCEGFGMLRSIILDFKALDFEIHTILDYRVFFLSQFLQADIIKRVDINEDYIKIFKTFAQKCDYVFIIAPETSNILHKLTHIAKKYDKIVLSTNITGIKLGSSKLKTFKFFKKNDIYTPKTYKIPYKKKFIDLDFILQKFRELKRPIVIKPEDGVGAESIYYFEKEDHILNYFSSLNNKLESKRTYILQEFIKGRDLSISLIGCPKQIDLHPIILSINSQNVKLENFESEYYGGYCPIEDLKDIFKKISFLINKFQPLKIEGYFGIDFIAKHDLSFSLIEINPRLTTSYIGLRKVINLNCAELIINSKFNFPSKPEIHPKFYSVFTRIDFSSDEFESMESFNNEFIPKLIKLIPEFVTPPISLNGSNDYSCFVATKTKDLNSSNKRLNEIIQSLKDLNFNVIKPIKIGLS
ncbi:MAG: ATP-grasp domain-containing protein [Candidatus Hermodarchaeota archaeon]